MGRRRGRLQNAAVAHVAACRAAVVVAQVAPSHAAARHARAPQRMNSAAQGALAEQPLARGGALAEQPLARGVRAGASSPKPRSPCTLPSSRRTP